MYASVHCKLCKQLIGYVHTNKRRWLIEQHLMKEHPTEWATFLKQQAQVRKLERETYAKLGINLTV